MDTRGGRLTAFRWRSAVASEHISGNHRVPAAVAEYDPALGIAAVNGLLDNVPDVGIVEDDSRPAHAIIRAFYSEGMSKGSKLRVTRHISHDNVVGDLARPILEAREGDRVVAHAREDIAAEDVALDGLPQQRHRQDPAILGVLESAGRDLPVPGSIRADARSHVQEARIVDSHMLGRVVIVAFYAEASGPAPVDETIAVEIDGEFVMAADREEADPSGGCSALQPGPFAAIDRAVFREPGKARRDDVCASGENTGSFRLSWR